MFERRRPRPAHIPPQGKEDDMESPRLEYTSELLCHFADLRDGTHGGASSRQGKEHLFTAAVALLDPHARQPLQEINTDLLLSTGEVTATGVRRRDLTAPGPRRGRLCCIWLLRGVLRPQPPTYVRSPRQALQMRPRGAGLPVRRWPARSALVEGSAPMRGPRVPPWRCGPASSLSWVVALP